MLPVLREILELDVALAPLLEKLEGLKVAVREFGPGSYIVDGLGIVEVSAPSLPRSKGIEIQLVPEALETLDPTELSALYAKGVIANKVMMTRAVGSKVTIKPTP